MRWFVLALLFGATLQSVPAQTLAAPEYKIKAAFLFNFAVLTEWPTNAFASEKAPLKIGVLGKDPFGRLLEDAMRDKNIHGRKIEIKRFKQLKDLETCHLLFISLSEEEHLEEISALLAKQPVLTVSEIDRFNFRGGLIWLIKEKDEIKFRIRKGKVRENGLKLSSKLLTLAINADPKPKGGN